MLTALLTSVLLTGGLTILTEDAKLVPADMSEYGGFGSRVVVDGDTAVITASGNDFFGLDAGAAWVFHRNADGDFEQVQLFAGDDVSFLDEFGYSVALQGEMLVIGARFHIVDGQVNAGAAYIFEQGSDGLFTQTQKLTAPDPIMGASYGTAVDTDGDRIVVGARYGDEGAGGAWVYGREADGEWGLEAELVGTDIDEGDRFGRTVSVEGDRVACGAPWFAAGCSGTNQCGSVFIFEHDGVDWVQTDRIVPDDHANEDYFGFIVDLGEDRLMATSVYDDDMGSQSGSGYVFDLADGDWSQSAKLVAPDGMPHDFMGMCGQLDGDRAVLGGWYGNDSRGAAWLWQHGADGWDFLVEAWASDGEGFDIFGRSVALDGDTLLVGADWADVDGIADAGAVYVFDVSDGQACPGDTDGNGAVDVDDILAIISQFGGSGGSGDVNGDGTVDVNDLLLVIGNFGPC